MRIVGYLNCALSVLLTMLMVAGCGKEQQPETGEHHGEHGGESSESSIVHLDKHKVFHAGIKVETVEAKSVPIPLTLPGRVSFNERRLAQITARLGGRIEKVRVFTNDQVAQGGVLLEMYSQEYLTMQNEFLQSASRWNRIQQSALEEKTIAKAIYESSHRKLAVVGLSGEEIQDIESSRTPNTLFVVRAPFAGTILESKIRQGTYVEANAELFELADFSTLWILADIYEKDLPHVRVGMKAHVEVASYPQPISGTVATINKVLDEKTRTVKARVEVRNDGGLLKPGMFCTVKIQTQLGKETIKIPASSLLGETEKHFVFVARNDTTFERRDVRTGVETRDFAEILDGLIVGESIVVRGGFFLKSELAKETFGEEH